MLTKTQMIRILQGSEITQFKINSHDSEHLLNLGLVKRSIGIEGMLTPFYVLTKRGKEFKDRLLATEPFMGTVKELAKRLKE